MNDLAINVEGLGKRYHIPGEQPAYRTLRDAMTSACVAPLKRMLSVARGHGLATAEQSQAVWALRDVSFQVRRGEVLGVIGRNGSGKSTLLKILSRIATPTTGMARIVGRVGSLLEVGTGFHFELSGRENVFLSGAMLGMRRSEILRKFDEIVEFSQIGRFLDTPVKHYSSGMYMRLAFSVAANLQSEILLVDEVLAVGDLEFQQKCLNKMRELTRSGRTVLFVAHNMASIESLCDRALLLDGGQIRRIGRPVDVIPEYAPQQQATAAITWSDEDAAPGNEFVRLQSAGIHTSDGRTASEIGVADDFTVRVAFWNRKPDVCYTLRVVLRDSAGACVFTAENHVAADDQHDPWSQRPFPAGLFESHCHVPGHLLNNRRYVVGVEIYPRESRQAEHRLGCDDLLTFQVVDQDHGAVSVEPHSGLVRPRVHWRTDLKHAA